MDNRGKVIAKLRAASGNFVSGQSLCDELGVSRSAVWKMIEELRAEGYDIEAKVRSGYRLARSPDVLDAGELEALCGGWRFKVFDQVGSTNTLARTFADEGESDRTIVTARAQTGGKGRFLRRFDSAEDMGVWMSLLLCPACGPDEGIFFTIAAAVSVNDAFEKLIGSRAGIKWVNDLMFGGKKAVGILTEASTEGETGRLNHLVVGIGVNLAQESADFPPELRDSATSVKMVSGKLLRRAEFIQAFTEAFDGFYQNGRIVDKAGLIETYRRDLFMLGREVEVKRLNGEGFRAKAVDIDRTGSLILQLEDGSQISLSSGEVSVRPLEI